MIERNVSKLGIVRQALGEPAISARFILVYRADPIESLKRLPPRLFDLVIADPSEGIAAGGDVAMPLDDYLRWCIRLLNEGYRVTAEDGALWVKLSQVPLPSKAQALPLSYLLWDKTPFSLVQEVIWDQGSGVPNRSMFQPGNERYLWLVRSLSRYKFNAGQAARRYTPGNSTQSSGQVESIPLTDVWHIPVRHHGPGNTGASPGLDTVSMAESSPKAVIGTIIRCCSYPHDLVLDPLVKNANTLLVAAQEQRPVIGFVTDERDIPAIRRQLLDTRPAERRGPPPRAPRGRAPKQGSQAA